VTFKASAAERDKTKLGFVSQAFPDLPFTIGGEINFDPKSLFVTSTDWKNAELSLATLNKGGLVRSRLCAGEFAQAVGQESGRERNTSTGQDTKKFLDCLTSVDRPRSKTAKLLAALVPTFQFKKETQFDFVKASGVFVPLGMY
jgi:hypothetical protein